MRDRIKSQIGGDHDADVFVGNVHRFCSKFLFEEGLVPAGATVIDDDDAISILSRFTGQDEELTRKNRNLKQGCAIAVHLAAFMHQITHRHPRELRLHPECMDGDDIRAMREICAIQRMDFTADTMTDIYLHTDFYRDAANSQAYPISMHQTVSALLDKMSLARNYEKYKQDNALLDFEDLLLLTYDAVSNKPKGTYKTYSWVQVDEVQDLNPLQLTIVDYFTNDDHPTVVYLGDEQQAIFSFMGARLETLEKLKERCAGNIHRLDENHRSPRYMLRVLNTYATDILGISPELLPSTTDQSEAQEGDLVILTGNTIDDEYQLVSEKAATLKQNYPTETTAIIVNSNADAEILSSRLQDLGVSHFKISGDDVFTSPGVKLLLSHLCLLGNESCFMAWAHLVKGLHVFETNVAARNFVRATMQHGLLPSDYLRNDGLTYVQDFVNRYGSEEIVVFDTETTGLDVLEDDILQIAAVKVRDGQKVEGSEFTVYMRSSRPIPAKLGDIDNPIIEEMKHVDTASHEQGLRAFIDYAGKATLIGHNVNFDYQILSANLRRYLPGTNLSELHPVYLDTLKLARMLWPGLKNYKLKSLLEEFHLEGHNTHLADADVEATVYLANHCFAQSKAILPAQQSFLQRNNIVNRSRDLKRKYAAVWEKARARRFVPDPDGLVHEAERFYAFTLTHKYIEEVPKMRYILRYLSTCLIDSTKEKTLEAQLSAHFMEINTLKEADLCSGDVVDERIYVTTIHKAKGLEFDNVIVFDAVEGRIPNYFNRENKALLAEDARKFYVALSRARRRITVAASAMTFDYHNQPRPRSLTRFMGPLMKFFSAQ